MQQAVIGPQGIVGAADAVSRRFQRNCELVLLSECLSCSLLALIVLLWVCCRPWKLGCCLRACGHKVYRGVPEPLSPDIHTARLLPAAHTSSRNGWGRLWPQATST